MIKLNYLFSINEKDKNRTKKIIARFSFAKIVIFRLLMTLWQNKIDADKMHCYDIGYGVEYLL